MARAVSGVVLCVLRSFLRDLTHAGPSGVPFGSGGTQSQERVCVRGLCVNVASFGRTRWAADGERCGPHGWGLGAWQREPGHEPGRRFLFSLFLSLLWPLAFWNSLIYAAVAAVTFALFLVPSFFSLAPNLWWGWEDEV